MTPPEVIGPDQLPQVGREHFAVLRGGEIGEESRISSKEIRQSPLERCPVPFTVDDAIADTAPQRPAGPDLRQRFPRCGGRCRPREREQRGGSGAQHSGQDASVHDGTQFPLGISCIAALDAEWFKMNNQRMLHPCSILAARWHSSRIQRR